MDIDEDDLLGTAPDAAEVNLKIALKLASQGFPVFPCREATETVNGRERKDKSPLTKNGFKDASIDAATIRRWWKNRPYALVGLPTGAASKFAVLDLDRHTKESDGIAALREMGHDPNELTNTVVKTAGGGLHLYFRWSEGITNKDKHLPKGIDVRAEGGYVIAPGSRYADGRLYSGADLGADVPRFPKMFMPPAEERRGVGETGDNTSLGLSIGEIQAYMDDFPNADLGREEWLVYIAALSHEAMMPDEDGKVRSKQEQEAILQIALDWTASDPEYASEESLKSVRDTFRTFRHSARKEPRTMRSVIKLVNNIRMDQGVENDFDDVDDFDDLGGDETSADDDDFEDLLGGSSKNPTKSQRRLAKEEVEKSLGKDAPKWVRRLNKRFSVAIVSGKTVILHHSDDGDIDYGSANDLHVFHENDRVPKDDTTVPITKVWIQSKYRRTYPRGVVFAPNQVVEGAYNHWQGFSVEPSTARDPSRGCRLFLKHLLEVACDGNEEYYRYHLGWLAHLIQKPEEKPGVAVIYKGKKRIGKDTVFEYVGELFKNHYITIANQDQMTGKFNHHHSKALLMHMQEGFWAGNKQAEGSLKYLITSTAVMIEPKGVNAFQIRSVLRLFISSNERWVVPATEDEGRFFVLNVSDRRRGDHKYFAALRDEMLGDGPSSLLAYLQQYDISKFQVRAVPDTEALAEQKEHGLKNIEAWWRDTLYRGEIDGMQNREDGVENSVWSERHVRIDKNEFRENYSRWMRSRRFDGEELSEIEFGMRLKALCPSAKGMQVRAGGRRYMVYSLPSLSACRFEFETFLGSSIPWPDNQQIVEQIEDDLG